VPFHQLRKRRAGSLAQRVEAGVAPDARGKVLSIDLAEGSNLGIPALLSNFAVKIAAAIVEACTAMVSRHLFEPFPSNVVDLSVACN
jgi:hypothetical protein